MATCTPQAVEADSTCFRCIPEKDLAAMQVYLLCQILQQFKPAMDCSAQSLRDASSCYRCKLSGKELYAAMVYLLCQILNNLGGGDSAVVWHGNVAPSIPGGDSFIVYFDHEPGCNSIWFWDPVTAVWTEFDVEGMTGNFVVPTVVELRQIVTVNCPPVSAVTIGNLVARPPDGQGAHYSFDADDTQADNGMSVIIPNDIVRPDPGSWIQFSPA